MNCSQRRLALYPLVQAQPEDKVNLNRFVSGCGTIFCIGGLAATHGLFVAEGLCMEVGFPCFEGNTPGLESLAVFFGTDVTYFYSKEPEEAGLTHKQAALARLRHMLVEEGDITQERADELAAAEGEAVAA